MKDMVQDKERLNMTLYISEENLNELIFNTLKSGCTMKEIHELLDKMNVVTNIRGVQKHEPESN
jgi:hypothetical protein